jgi:hypothetical protein
LEFSPFIEAFAPIFQVARSKIRISGLRKEPEIGGIQGGSR